MYYADIVCARAKNHYTPGATGMEFSDSASQMTSNQANASLQMFREGFKPVHPNQTKLMYFSVRVSVCFIVMIQMAYVLLQ